MSPEPSPPRPLTRRQSAAVFGALGLALGLLAFGFLGAVFVWGTATPGTVVAENEDSKGTCAPVLQYDAGGRQYRELPRARFSSDCGWSVGEKVTVYYWSDEPEKPSLLSFASVFVPALLPAALLLVGLWLALTKPALRPGQ